MAFLVSVVLFGWIPAVMLMFSVLSGRRAAILSFVLAWMFLPVAGYKCAGLQPYDKMSPQLHRMLYGFVQESWDTTKRGGGWRPLVFMQTGLMVGTWMTSVAVLAFWGWWRRAMRPIWGLPMGMVTLILVVTALLCKSAGAI